jgi:hypothetical protein
MSNTVPSLLSDPLVISSTAVITTADLHIEAQTLFDGRMITVTRSITDMHVITATAAFTTGYGVISDTAGYTETHIIHVIGFDAAGNKTESEKVRIYTIHKPKEEKKETPTPAPVTMLIAPAAPDVIVTSLRRYLRPPSNRRQAGRPDTVT